MSNENFGVEPQVNNSQPPPRRTSLRGFASMDPAKQRAIASKGGQAAHRSGRAHEFNSAEAAEAGRKGGVIVSQNREHMARIGAEGGRARALNHRNLQNLGTSNPQ